MNPNLLKRLFPNASSSTFKRNAGDSSEGVRPDQPECSGRSALELQAPGKTKSGAGPAPSSERYRIVFHVYSIRPFDWDNYSTKELQDIIVRSGILSADNWRVLEGSVIPHKAQAPDEERTVVEITRIA